MKTIWTLSIALACMAAPAVAADTNVDSDLRCLATFSAVAAGADASEKPQVAAAVMYFVGRVDGEKPNIDLTTELIRVSSTMKQEQLAGEIDRCGKLLAARGTALAAVGQAMSAQKAGAKP